MHHNSYFFVDVLKDTIWWQFLVLMNRENGLARIWPGDGQSEPALTICYPNKLSSCLMDKFHILLDFIFGSLWFAKHQARFLKQSEFCWASHQNQLHKEDSRAVSWTWWHPESGSLHHKPAMSHARLHRWRKRAQIRPASNSQDVAVFKGEPSPCFSQGWKWEYNMIEKEKWDFLWSESEDETKIGIWARKWSMRLGWVQSGSVCHDQKWSRNPERCPQRLTSDLLKPREQLMKWFPLSLPARLNSFPPFATTSLRVTWEAGEEPRERREPVTVQPLLSVLRRERRQEMLHVKKKKSPWNEYCCTASTVSKYWPKGDKRARLTL